MPKYDFNKLLEPYEFQYFVRDILQIKENTTFESFTPGPDGGIDLRKEKNNNTIIVQIKRYKNYFPKFLNSLKKYELPKVKRLNPDRYIIVTSVTLTVDQKEKVKDLFKGYIKTSEDIISEIDLNNLLAIEEYKSVELNYPNLWFNSSNTFFEKMEKLINNDLYEEARYEYENIIEFMKYYIPVPKFKEIISNLKYNKYILITGNPGVGKTSLARALTAYFIAKENYEFIFLRNIENANKLYNPNKKQLFFIDDFWGSSFKEKDYNYNDERRLAEFITKVNKSTNKILILTTRDYVLKQGLLLNNDIEEVLTKNLHILDLNKYSNKTKADILIRHLMKSNLPYRYIYHTLDMSKNIINHRNFNPRIIKSYINSGMNLEVNKYKYVKYFIETLDEPFNFLDKIYKKQSKEARLLLYIMLSINNSVLLSDLQIVYTKALDKMGIRNIFNSNIENIISQLEKNFIKTKYLKKYGIVVEFLNPSIKDYLLEYQENFLEFSNIIIDSIRYFNQIEFFLNKNKFYKTINITDEEKNEVTKKLITNFDNLRIIRGDFFETIPFEQLSNDEQLLYKIKRLSHIENINADLIDLILENIEKIIASLKNNNRKYIPKEDLPAIIDLIGYYNEFKQININEVIEIYYDNCIFAYELYLIKEFNEEFPKEYKEFIKDKKDIIEKKLKEMIYEDLDYFYYEENYQALKELIFLLENDLYYLCKNDENLLSEIEYYDHIPNSYYEEQDELYYTENETNFNFTDEESEDIENYCLNYIDFEKEYISNVLDEKTNSEELKKVLETDNYNAIYNTSFNEETANYLIEYYNEYKIIPKNISTFTKMFIDYIFNKNKFTNKKYFELLILIAFETFIKNEKNFSLSLFNDTEIEINDTFIDELLNSPLFIKKDKWFSFSSSLIQIFSICYAISILDKESKEKIYNDLIFAISPLNQQDFDFEEELYIFYIFLLELDSEIFSKKFINAYFKEFIKEINACNDKSIIKSIIEYFHLSIYLDNLSYKSIENTSVSFINPTTWDLLTLIMDNNFLLDKFINKEAFKEFKKKFKDYIKKTYDYHNYEINLEELLNNQEFYDWLKKYNIDKKILNIYHISKFIALYTTDNYAKSYKEYKKMINKKISELNKKVLKTYN